MGKGVVRDDALPPSMGTPVRSGAAKARDRLGEACRS